MKKLLFNSFSRTFILLSGIMLLLAACNSRPDGVMSKSEMVDFLTDLHKLDGALATNGIGSSQDRENIYYYNSLLKKHEITKANFDSSLVWYSRNPKNFEKIYAQVVENLTEFDKEVKSGKFNPVDSAALRHSQQNIWIKPTRYAFTKDSARTQVEFTIQNPLLQWKDYYTLSFIQRIVPRDSSSGQFILLRINYSGGIADSVYASAHNDSILRRYTLSLPARKQRRIESITGKLLGSKSYNGKMGALIDSIKLIRIYDAVAQDSINRVINLIENPVSVVPSEPIIEKKRLRSKVLMYKE